MGAQHDSLSRRVETMAKKKATRGGAKKKTTKASARKPRVRDLSTRKGDLAGGGQLGGQFGQFGSIVKKTV
jgi:hypothetical protein